MKKKIEWWLVQADGTFWFKTSSRASIRQCKRNEEADIFEEWNMDIKYPLKIVRREYHLVDEKVVR